MTANDFRNTADLFTKAYVEAALWSSTGDDGMPLNHNRCIEDIAPETLDKFAEDCKSFQQTHQYLLCVWYDSCHETEERAGHDFWLTRNGHGAGYWDRWSGATPQAAVGKQLTDAADAYGECDLYVGDDGMIYC